MKRLGIITLVLWCIVFMIARYEKDYTKAILATIRMIYLAENVD